MWNVIEILLIVFLEKAADILSDFSNSILFGRRYNQLFLLILIKVIIRLLCDYLLGDRIKILLNFHHLDPMFFEFILKLSLFEFHIFFYFPLFKLSL